MTAAFTGFITSLGLILAIGAQNAFVLRQGLKREHVGVIVIFCAFSDAVLILLGVYGFAAIVAKLPWLEPILLYGGIAFLLFYAGARFRAMFQHEAMSAKPDAAISRKAAIGMAAAFTFLNPHVYLDTFMLIGNISSPYQGTAKMAFALGAISASFVFFACLGYGARALAPVFAKPRAWQVLDFLIGCLMLYLAWHLWQGR